MRFRPIYTGTMSFPRAKTPVAGSVNAASKTAAETTSSKEKSAPSAQKAPVQAVVKASRIPRHEKQSVSHSVVGDRPDVPEPSLPERRDEEEASTISSRPASKSQGGPLSTTSTRPRSSVPAIPVSSQKRVLENQFITKKKRYVTLRRDIVDKQKSTEVAFEELIQLKKRILLNGGRDPGPLEELVPAPSVTVHGRSATALPPGATPTKDADYIVQLEAGLRELPEPALAFAGETIDRSVGLTSWFAGTIESDNWREEATRKLGALESEDAELRARLGELREQLYQEVDSLTQRVRCLWHESQVLRREREQVQAENGDYEELAKELRAEKEKLAKAKAKAREQEASIAAAETKLRQALESQKQLEAQLKQREVALESKSRDSAKCQRLEKQRETVESRVGKLKEELESKERESKALVEEYVRRVESLEQELENEREQRREVDSQFEQFRARNGKLEEKCRQLLEMQEKRKEVVPDDQHSEHEIQLFNDLKEAQARLAEKEEVIQKLQIERENIIAAVSEADQENDSSKQKLSAELVRTSNELHTTKSQLAQLQKHYMKMQQKAECLEQKLSDVARLQAQMRDGGRASQVVQLQQQLTDSLGALNEARERGAELEKTCAQQEVKLERYKRYVRNLDQDLKLRREVQQLLQHGDGVFDEQNHPDAEDFQQLHAALESREAQVRKLEKLVKQMEKQEEYAQTQRTRLEARIGELEFALLEGKQANRNRGFSFL